MVYGKHSFYAPELTKPTQSPAAAETPAPTPTPTEELPAVTVFPGVDGEQPVETAEVQPGDAPVPAPEPQTYIPWIAAGAALAAALIVSAVFLALRRRRKLKRRPARKAVLSIGKVHAQGRRESQQDCFAVSPDELAEELGLLVVVADGMGGLSDGDMVSQTAVSAMLDGFCNVRGEPRLVLLELVRKANQAVNRLLGPDKLSKSGSTLAAALIKDGAVHWLSVGDSRIALLRGGELYQLNREHIYENELLLGAVNGTETFDGALTNPRRAGLTSYLGMGRLKYIDMPAQPLPLREGDKLILMSDGVYNALGDAELKAALGHSAQQAAKAVENAIEAKGYAAQDNFTAVIVEAGGSERQEG